MSFSSECEKMQFHEAPLIAPVGQKVVQIAGKAAASIASDFIPGFGTLSALIGAARDVKTAMSDHDRINVILKAISVDDSSRSGAWSKLDIDDRIYNMLSDQARRDIAAKIAKYLRGVTDINRIPDGLGNSIAKAYIGEKIR